MKRESLNSCAPNSFLWTVEGNTDSHAPVHWIRPSCQASGFDAAARASTRAVYTSSVCLCCISSLPYPIRREWSPELNSAIPRSATTRCPVIMQDTAQFSPTVQVGLGMAILACLTGRPVINLPGIWAVSPWKRSGRNMSWNASSTTWKAIPMYGVMRRTKANSWWRDFCRPTYAVCECWLATLETLVFWLVWILLCLLRMNMFQNMLLCHNFHHIYHVTMLVL